MTNDFWNARPVLITGISGFLGAWLARTLVDRKAHVVGLDQDPAGALALHPDLEEQVTVVPGNVCSVDDVARALDQSGARTCFHLAGQSIIDPNGRSPLTTFETNVAGTWATLEAVRRAGDRIEGTVVASSNHVYGEHADSPFDEEFPLHGTNPYAASKVCADAVSRCFAATYQLPVVVARNTNTYGGADPHDSHIVTASILSILRGRAPQIFSDGTPVKSYLYVKDTISGYLTLGQHASREDVRGRAFNLCTDAPISVLDLVWTIIRAAGVDNLEPDVHGSSGQPAEQEFLSNKRAKAVLGWVPEYSVEDGIRETFGWYQARHQ